MHKFFGSDLKCETAARSFSRPPVLSERFAHSASYQYYQPLSDLTHLTGYLQLGVCAAITSTEERAACAQHTTSLKDAASIDIDYDAISHALTITAVWNRPEVKDEGRSKRSPLTVSQVSSSDRVEVGILSQDTADEPEELKLGGWLTVLGEDKKPSEYLSTGRVCC